MSDLNLDTSTAGSPAPDVSSIAAPDAGSSAAETPAADTAGAPETDVFADLDADSIFGFKKDDGQPSAETKKPDVTVTDPPAPRQGDQEIAKPAADGQPADAANDTANQTTESQAKSGFTPNEKLNWEDDKVPFREEYNALKNAYLELEKSSMEGQFISSPEEFVQRMKETSPTSFTQVGAMLAEESAKAHPDRWAEFLIENNADLVAQKITGREDMTADRLRAELEVVLDEDDPDVKAVMERQKAEAASKAPAAKPEETQEQKRIRELLEKEEQREAAAFRSEVFGPVEAAVDSLISQAGLEINRSELDGKTLKDLDPETKFKVMINDLMPVYIGRRADADPVLKNMQARLEQFEKAKDIKSALSMQHAIKIAVTNFAGEFLETMTAQRAIAKEKDAIPPRQDIPQPIVKSAGASSSPSAPSLGPLTDDDWKVTDSDIIRR